MKTSAEAKEYLSKGVELLPEVPLLLLELLLLAVHHLRCGRTTQVTRM